MAAIGSKRQRFVGDGNDSMRVTSLVRSLVDLPYVTGTGTSSTRIHPSPGSIVSNRLVVQSDDTARECVAFVASGGGVWRHAVPFSGGEDVAEGKEAMLKPTTVTDGVTRRCRGIRHAAEIQSLALHDKADGDEVRLASADATGKTLVTFLKRDGSDCLPVPGFDKGKRWVLQASDTSDKSSSPTPSGWTGVCFNQRNPDQVAVAKHHSKTVDVFDGETLVRRMRTPLMPRAVAYVDSNGTMGKQSETNNPLLAVAEGNALSLWDVRQSERGGCVKRVTLCNRGQPLYAVASATSQGNLGGGAVKIGNKITHGDPLVITAGAERGIHVLDVARFSICKRWPSAMKFDITRSVFLSRKILLALYCMRRNTWEVCSAIL